MQQVEVGNMYKDNILKLETLANQKIESLSLKEAQFESKYRDLEQRQVEFNLIEGQRNQRIQEVLNSLGGQYDDVKEYL